MQGIREKYLFYEDMQNTIILHQFPGTVRTSRKGWIFITRNVFFVNSYTPVTMRIKLFCELEKYMVRVFDNDTGREVKIYTNNVVASEYPHNFNGYTVLCYGWTLMEMTLPYKLFLVINKKITEPVTFSNNMARSEVIRENYIPNSNNLICKYQILIRSECVLLTVHFTANFPKAMIQLKLYHQDRTLVQLVYGEGDALIPVVMLTYTQEGHLKKASNESHKSLEGMNSKSRSSRTAYRSKKTNSKTSQNEDIIPDVYFLEARILENSWPLTAEEWKVVGRLRKHMLMGDPEATSTPSKIWKRDQLEHLSPGWYMEMIYNSTDLVTFVKDERREKEIWNIKEKWYEKDPSRYARSQQLRETFIAENKIPNPDLCESLIERSLQPEVFQREIVSPCDITPYLLVSSKEQDGAERVLLTTEDLEKVELDEWDLKTISRISQSECQLELDQVLDEQLENYRTSEDWYHDCRMESKQLIELAYSQRQKYMNNVMQSSKEHKGAKPGAKVKSARKR
ncbi:hypothetical protein JTB14_010781 [Gonioctena quinquepunctata]|nr:hypothetical protein JTB14_010781 [Gonioctena quinquepunctata]